MRERDRTVLVGHQAPLASDKGRDHNRLGLVDANVQDVPETTGFQTVSPDGRPFTHRKIEEPASFVERSCDPLLLDEMAELYGLALLRDVSFRQIGNCSTLCGPTLVSPCDVAVAIAPLPVNRPALSATCMDHSRTLFRKIMPTAARGPFVSQFLLIGAPHQTRTGQVEVRGVQESQKQRVMAPGLDFMTDWASWLDVQRGARMAHLANWRPEPVFLTTPRDLGVLAQEGVVGEIMRRVIALLTAYRVPNSSGWATPEAQTLVRLAGMAERIARQRALAGGLEGQIRQFPEQVGGMLSLVANGQSAVLGDLENPYLGVHRRLKQSHLLAWIDSMNRMSLSDTNLPLKGRGNPEPGWVSCLLPMGWPDGALPGRSQGAVLGAQIGAAMTVVKAAYDMFAEPNSWQLRTMRSIGLRETYEPTADGSQLITVYTEEMLGLAGELDKVAANLVTGAMALGLCFRSSAIAGLRMGQDVACALLEQHLNKIAPGQSLRLPGFFGERIQIGQGAWSPDGRETDWPDAI